jgi:hypothetical protein
MCSLLVYIACETHRPMDTMSPSRSKHEAPVLKPLTNTPLDSRLSSHRASSSHLRAACTWPLLYGVIWTWWRETPSQASTCVTRFGIFFELLNSTTYWRMCVCDRMRSSDECCFDFDLRDGLCVYVCVCVRV